MYNVIPDFSSYLVTDKGEILSLPRCKWPKNQRVVTKWQKELKTHSDPQGYRKVQLVNNAGLAVTMTVHRLVCLAFLGKPLDGQEVNHKNGSKSDNRLENLEYVTHSRNIKHAFDTGLMFPNKGSSNQNSKHTELEIKTVWELMKSGRTPKQAHKLTGVSYHTCKLIYAGKSWQHICTGEMPLAKPKASYYGVLKTKSGNYKCYVWHEGKQIVVGTYANEDFAAQKREEYLDGHPEVKSKRNAVL